MRAQCTVIMLLAAVCGGCGWEIMPVTRTGASGGQPAHAPVALPEGIAVRGAAEERAALASPGPQPTDAMLQRGAELYRVYCTPCHGSRGSGDGSAVLQGFPRPPSLLESRIRDAAPRRIVDVISNGAGIMYGFDGRIPPAERWAIAHHVRRLQQNSAGVKP